MPMNSRLLRPLATNRFAAVARDAGGSIIQPVLYAEGGENYVAHIFTSSGTLEFLRAVDVEYLIVAGGGGGGGAQSNAQTAGGGGGAGGFVTNAGGPSSVSAGSYAVTVGAGGAGGLAGANGSDGNASSVLGISSTGGGGGGFGLNSAGRLGGSGGGGGANTGAAGAAVAGQGNAGAAGYSNNLVRVGGGGGGAGGAGVQGASENGSSSSVAHVGGDGLSSTLSGSSAFYAGGGGGGQALFFGLPAPAQGGVGGGGDGDRNGTGGTAGAQSTGGGGGGAGRNVTANPPQSGYAGGSGIVIVRYKRNAADAAWDSDALAYIAAVEAADNDVLEPGIRAAYNDFITGCKSDGIWDAIKASCILAGARTLAGALVPLVGTAPTNNNFVSGDYDRETGLVGNGSTKYLDTNRANNADPQDDNHHSLYISTAASTSPSVLMGSGGAADAGKNRFTWVTGDFSFDSRSLANLQESMSATSPTGFVGHARSAGATADYRIAGSTSSASQTSTTPNAVNVIVFARNGGGVPTNARLAFYSIGESLDLEALDTRVSALITAIGAAI